MLEIKRERGEENEKTTDRSENKKKRGNWEGMGVAQEWRVQKEKAESRAGVGKEWEGRG